METVYLDQPSAEDVGKYYHKDAVFKVGLASR